MSALFDSMIVVALTDGGPAPGAVIQAAQGKLADRRVRRLLKNAPAEVESVDARTVRTIARDIAKGTGGCASLGPFTPDD